MFGLKGIRMLILSRRKDDELIFFVGDEEIVVRILKFKGQKVTIGIQAPKSVTITRKESPKYNPEKR